MDKLIQVLIAAGHGIVIQKVPLRLRVALAILLTGMVATLHHFAISRGWIPGDINDLVKGPIPIADKWAERLYGGITGVFVISVTGRPNEDSGLVPGIVVVPPKSPLDERPDSGGTVGVVTAAPAPEPLDRLN